VANAGSCPIDAGRNRGGIDRNAVATEAVTLGKRQQNSEVGSLTAVA
jgi:hypothetical protein